MLFIPREENVYLIGAHRLTFVFSSLLAPLYGVVANRAQIMSSRKNGVAFRATSQSEGPRKILSVN